MTQRTTGGFLGVPVLERRPEFHSVNEMTACVVAGSALRLSCASRRPPGRPGAAKERERQGWSPAFTGARAVLPERVPLAWKELRPHDEQTDRGGHDRPGHPGMDINGSGVGCNTLDGRFEVMDLATGSGGRIERLWIVYEQHCSGGPYALFGEVRVGEPEPGGALALEPSVVRWPGGDAGRPGAAVPVTVRATGSATVGRASITGAGADAFQVTRDDC
jgi:hypothetical protein